MPSSARNPRWPHAAPYAATPCWVGVIIPDHDADPQISVMDDQFGTHRTAPTVVVNNAGLTTGQAVTLWQTDACGPRSSEGSYPTARILGLSGAD
ncbi:MAG: hypothetical protein JO287_05535 [Pseudonocardiales bacterium]|nr:hypothetical protein [Pseudonocardiales bacterium]